MKILFSLLFTLFTALPLSTARSFKVTVKVPAYVERGQDAILSCHPEPGLDKISSVTWIKDKTIIYRYTPAHKGRERQFNRLNNGLQFDEKNSNFTHLFLTSVEQSSEGNYTCKVQTVAPEYKISQNTSELRIFWVPKDSKNLVKIAQQDPDDLLSDLLCIAGPTYPGAELQWLIDGQPVGNDRTDSPPPEITPDGLMISKLALKHISKEEAGRTFVCKGQVQAGESVSTLSHQFSIKGDQLLMAKNSEESRKYARESHASSANLSRIVYSFPCFTLFIFLWTLSMN